MAAVTRPPTTAGMHSSGEAPSPPVPTTPVTRMGPRAKPMLPPTENQLIPTWLPPVTVRASRADSG